ncbi:MAG: family 1 glycosylhydrolase [Thermomicrobiales bacterium]
MIDPVESRVPLEMWGGLECTLNRVGDRFFDQIIASGHDRRPHDLDLFAALGIAAIRYPVLWERIAPGDPGEADWSMADDRLGRLRALGVRPIAGLVHHGSGPLGTDLLDPGFPAKLAAYAGSVARRYPWLAEYTPVNEPLTTARFSALYGHWYPHHRDESTFYRAVVTQCRGVAAAMRAIRDVNPAARLIQTEDLGEVFARPSLVAQAEYENERRWLSLDLLTGRVAPDHPFWSCLLDTGIAERDLWDLVERPCPPDVIGVNHYLTSERMLDDRLDRYPPWTHGGNGRDAYADVEAVRVCTDGPGGWDRLLRAAWQRYGLPVAATEVHLSCTREEQLRWLADVWDTAGSLRRDGVDVRAVTAWSLLGSFGWNRLVTEEGGDYEPGVFDLRASSPRPTALASLVRELATGATPSHPSLAVPGWWRRPSRFHYPPVNHSGEDILVETSPEIPPGAPGILVIGPDGPTRAALVWSCAVRGIPGDVREDPPRSQWASAVRGHIAERRPWAVVITSGLDDVGPGEVEAVAVACAAAGVAMALCPSGPASPAPAARLTVVTGSRTDQAGSTPGETVRPVERLVLGAHPGALVVLGGPRFSATLESGTRIAYPPDIHRGDDARDLADSCIDLLTDGERGVWQVARPGATARDRLELLDPADSPGTPERRVS